MKIFYKNTQTLTIILSLLFLLQSCHVYHKVPISLEEAVVANKRMKVITLDDKKYKFRKIEKTDSTYYGLLTTRGQDVKVPLNTEKIQSIHPVNKEASTLLSVGIIVAPIGIFMIVYTTSDLGTAAAFY